jgi:hypothetical protein
VNVEARASLLREEVTAHKAAIRHHRAALGRAKAALLALERECARRGIKLIVKGEGRPPWPKPDSPNPS